MNKREYTKTELGMTYGLLVGGAVAVIAFALTGDAWWLTFTGAGLALGLGIGTSMDQREG